MNIVRRAVVVRNRHMNKLLELLKTRNLGDKRSPSMVYHMTQVRKVDRWLADNGMIESVSKYFKENIVKNDWNYDSVSEVLTLRFSNN
jgi:hypothetical protein